MKLKQMSVKSNLTGGLGVLTVIVVILSGLALNELNDAIHRLSRQASGINARAKMAQSFRDAMNVRAIALRNFVLVTKPEDIELERAALIDADQRVEAALERLQAMEAGDADMSDKGRSLAAEMSRIEMLYRPIAQDISRLAMNNQRDAAIAEIDTKFLPLLSAMINAATDYADDIHANTAQVARATADRAARQRSLVIAICLVAIAMAALACVAVTRARLRAFGSAPGEPIQKTQRVAGSESSAMPGVTNASAGSVLASMGEMNSSSYKISRITGNIEGIVLQTDALALNASMEASRSDGRGRGVADVACEVRNLAQRSSSAAREIKELIDSSMQRILDGSSLANAAGTTLAEVKIAVARVSDITMEITAACAEHIQGIDLINQAIIQMDEVTQQNAALVKEAASASQWLVMLARLLARD